MTGHLERQMNKNRLGNRLQYETSPYLLQHAYNPVDWYAWKEEAFEKAQKENKPILVSIGYSTCHWCHVMERESFEDERIAQYMNENFVNIKVDREERPDVDQIYMAAVQAITGGGGWPLHCFLLPDGRPFYGGTYYPPKDAYNRPSWFAVLKNIAHTFSQKRETVESQAEKLMEYIKSSDQAFTKEEDLGLSVETIFSKDFAQGIFDSLRRRFDKVEGGFGSAPKFPSTMGLRYLMNYHYHTKNKAALEHLELSLEKMIKGGIYDHLGGGFCRYSTDNAWLVPHFEKMLYDNALLVNLLADAYKLTGKTLYKETVMECLEFIGREMTSEEGGFYTALDADTEGVEGKFYVWDKKEVEIVLGDDAELYSAFYGITEEGNWEEKNILCRSETFNDFARINDIGHKKLSHFLKKCNHALLKHRERRVRPGLDDKILLGWNALMCSAYAKAYEALQKEEYLEVAKQNLAFILQKLANEKGLSFFHTYKKGVKQYAAFLDDYAFLIDALINVYSITFEVSYLERAHELANYTIDKFFDKENKLFFYTSVEQKDLIYRRKDLYDGAVPSGNSMMIHNLQRLALIKSKDSYTQITEEMLLLMKKAMEKYAASFSYWSEAALNRVFPLKEIAIIGKDAMKIAAEVQQLFIGGRVIMASNHENENYALLDGREVEEETMIYLCEEHICKMPVQTTTDLLMLMNS